MVVWGLFGFHVGFLGLDVVSWSSHTVSKLEGALEGPLLALSLTQWLLMVERGEAECVCACVCVCVCARACVCLVGILSACECSKTYLKIITSHKKTYMLAPMRKTLFKRFKETHPP